MVLVGDTIEGHCRTRRKIGNIYIYYHPGPGHHTKQSSWIDLRSNDNVCLLGHPHAWVICSKASEMRVSTSKLTYVVFHMSLLQVAWGLTLVAQVCQKTFKITSPEFTYMCFYMPLLQSCLGGTPFGARSSGPEVRGPKFGARLLWHRYAKKNIWLHHHRSHTCASTCLCYKVDWGHSVRGPKFGARLLWHRYAKKHLITSSEFISSYVLLHAFATMLPGGHPIRGPKFGARLLWYRYAKKRLITSSSFTFMCFYVPLLQSCLGALCSGPEVRGPTLVV